MEAKHEEKPAVRMARLLKGTLVPRLVSEGVFGKDWRLDGVEAVPIGGLGEDHWASTTLTTTVHLVEANTGKRSLLPLVSKCMLPSDGFEGYSQPDVMGANEVAMYNKILPFLDRLGEGTGLTISDLHPKCYFAQSNVEDLLSLTVMGDNRAEGFSLAKERAALDKDHVMVVLRSIGRFHAFSYAAKARCRKEFMETLVPLLREGMFGSSWNTSWAGSVERSMMRGISRVEERLKDEDKDTDRHRRRLERLVRMRAHAKDPYPAMKAAISPQEPAGVLAHGDFCRNNMAFHYGEDGVPDRVRFFDYQTSRYCSPSVDVAFFLFLNTSAALRAQHWDDLFLEYFNSLKATLDRLLEGHAVDEDFVMPTLQSVHEDFRRNALMQYTICSFFLPQMMVPSEDTIPIEEMKDAWASDPEGTMTMMLGMAGEEGTDALAGIVMDFLDRDLFPPATAQC